MTQKLPFSKKSVILDTNICFHYIHIRNTNKLQVVTVFEQATWFIHATRLLVMMILKNFFFTLISPICMFDIESILQTDIDNLNSLKADLPGKEPHHILLKSLIQV